MATAQTLSIYRILDWPPRRHGWAWAVVRPRGTARLPGLRTRSGRVRRRGPSRRSGGRRRGRAGRAACSPAGTRARGRRSCTDSSRRCRPWRRPRRRASGTGRGRPDRRRCGGRRSRPRRTSLRRDRGRGRSASCRRGARGRACSGRAQGRSRFSRRRASRATARAYGRGPARRGPDWPGFLRGEVAEGLSLVIY